MICAADAQHPVINHLVTIRVGTDRFRHDGFHFLRHDAELAAMAALVAVFRFVVEQVDTDAERMVINADDGFLGVAVLGRFSRFISAFLAFGTGLGSRLRQVSQCAIARQHRRKVFPLLRRTLFRFLVCLVFSNAQFASCP